MNADGELIEAMEIELSYRDGPKTLEGILARLHELDEMHAGGSLPNVAIAEWRVLVDRALKMTEREGTA